MLLIILSGMNLSINSKVEVQLVIITHQYKRPIKGEALHRIHTDSLWLSVLIPISCRDEKSVGILKQKTKSLVTKRKIADTSFRGTWTKITIAFVVAVVASLCRCFCSSGRSLNIAAWKCDWSTNCRSIHTCSLFYQSSRIFLRGGYISIQWSSLFNQCQCCYIFNSYGSSFKYSLLRLHWEIYHPKKGKKSLLSKKEETKVRLRIMGEKRLSSVSAKSVSGLNVAWL